MSSIQEKSLKNLLYKEKKNEIKRLVFFLCSFSFLSIFLSRWPKMQAKELLKPVTNELGTETKTYFIERELNPLMSWQILSFLLSSIQYLFNRVVFSYNIHFTG